MFKNRYSATNFSFVWVTDWFARAIMISNRDQTCIEWLLRKRKVGRVVFTGHNICGK